MPSERTTGERVDQMDEQREMGNKPSCVTGTGALSLPRLE